MDVKRNNSIIINYILAGSIALFPMTNSISQETDVLTQYIREGLQNNLTLHQKQSSYYKSLEALKEAKGMFMPNVSLQARYTIAQGGRIIEFPVGDMLNPVYSTLNELTRTLPPDQQFSAMHLENEEFQFYRPTEQETKLRMIQPVYNPQIMYNTKIKSELVNTEKADAETYKRHLVEEIKTAYFNYFKTLQINLLLEQTTGLLAENIRTNEKLYENDMVTLDHVYRSQSELSKLEQQKAEALKGQKMAKAYFNFLLNRPLDAEIIEVDSLLLETVYLTIIPSQENALDKREELLMLNCYQNISHLNYKLNQSNRYPTVLAVIDYGFEGARYEFTGEQDFMLASLAMQWDIFKGFQNDAKVQQARIEKDIIENKKYDTEAQIKLEVMNAYYSLEAAFQFINAAENQAKTSRESYRLMDKKYSQGQANLLEYIDARTTMTNAEMNLIIARYDYHIQYAHYERTACLFDLTIYEN